MSHGSLKTRSNDKATRGVTLLELLIVMTIMVMITAASVPIMLPALKNRQLRESSRLVSSYLSGARALAIENGRPVGVMFERQNDLAFAPTLSYVEVPSPYAGDSIGSKMVVAPSGQVTFIGVVANVSTLPNAPNVPDDSWVGQIHGGDLVRLAYHSGVFALNVPGVNVGQAVPSNKAPTTGSPWTLVPFATASPVVIPPAYANGVAYQIIRQPVRSSAPPLVLPAGTGVDLAASGFGTTGQFPSPLNFNPMILFAPNGGVDRATLTSPQLARPMATLFLLVGRRELMNDVYRISGTLTDGNVHEPTNNRHLDNFWVSVGYQSGLVVTAENTPQTTPPTPPTYTPDLSVSRRIAQQAQSLGGR